MCMCVAIMSEGKGPAHSVEDMYVCTYVHVYMGMHVYTYVYVSVYVCI